MVPQPEDSNKLASRNTSIGFAQRTLKNLEYIEGGGGIGQGHVVTQTVLSVLGLVVFPWAAGFDTHLKNLKYEQLVNQGWPNWTISLGRTGHACGTGAAHS